jgi:hypothetical protein
MHFDRRPIMDMKKLNAGKLRAIGYDTRNRVLRVEFDDGSAIDYSNVSTDVWRRFSSAGAPWSFYRDNIEEEFAGTRGRSGGDPEKKQADRDALFKAFGGEAGDTDGA